MLINFEIDPLGKFPASPNAIMEAAGLLPHWLNEGVSKGEPAKDALISRYQFYMGPMTGGEIIANGSYRFPDDPDLYPIVKADLTEEVVYFYQHAIVGIVNKTTGEQFVTRMD